MITARISPDRRTATVPHAASGAEYYCFRPDHPRQFAAGFEPNRYYFEPIGRSFTTPQSAPFASLTDAIKAVNPPVAARV